ncbi:hypothetical protein KKC91_00895 [bacterium]|nr:hypothetical protein [bacterium]
MLILVRLFGVVIICMGIIFLINPKAVKQYISYWKEGKKLRVGGIISILFGIIFLIAAPQCRLTGFITVLGIWSIIKGVLLLTLSQKMMAAYLDWWSNKPILATRFLSIFILAFGVLLIYSA